jgi:hypothetical protein
VLLGLGVAIEQAADEGDQRNPLQLRAALGLRRVLRGAHHRVEPVGVAERLGREGRDDLAEADIAVRERQGIALRPEEDRADDRASPPNRRDDDRPHVAHIEQRPDVPEHGLGGRVGDEDRLTRLERPLELGVAGEVDHQIADGRVFVARDQPDIGRVRGQEDRAAIEAERLAQLAGDGLQDLAEVERARDILEDIDERDEVVTLAAELLDLGPEAGDVRRLRLVRRWRRGCRW